MKAKKKATKKAAPAKKATKQAAPAKKPAKPQREKKKPIAAEKRQGTSGRKASQLGLEELEVKGIWVSVNQFVHETGKDRQSIDKKLRLNIITPVQHQGRPLYRLRDLIDLVFYRDDKGKVDIDRLDPFRRKAHYSAENDKLKMLQTSRMLIPVGEVEAEQARVAKILTQFLDTLPDVLERDCGLGAAALAKLEQRVDTTREELYKAVAGEDEDDEPGSDSGSV